MAAFPQLMTVAQYWELPDDDFPDAFLHELQHGEIVALPRPKHGLYALQHRIHLLLDDKLRSHGMVGLEMPYRPLPEFELRRADVAFVSQERWSAVNPDDVLHGSPELVVEIRSPSSTDEQLREILCYGLGNGALEVWIVDSSQKSISVFRSDGIPAVFNVGDSLSLSAFGGGELAVNEIFG
jgi:Uma2 family endonuclease